MDLAHTLGTCPDQGSNPQLFGVQEDAPTTEPVTRAVDKLVKTSFSIASTNKYYKMCSKNSSEN